MLVKRAACGGGLLWLVPAALGFDRAAAAAADEEGIICARSRQI